MKKLIFVLSICFLLVSSTQAQLDRSKRPEPAPAREIQLGKFDSFKLSNGLEVIVVENRKIPVVSFSLRLIIDPLDEGNAVGYSNLAGMLMREGTKTRTKHQIDEQIDFIGASLSTSATGMFGSTLKRNQETLLELMQDILLNPTFPEEELQKRLNQMRSGFEANRNDANFIAGNISSVTRFGSHPYGQVQTPEHLDNINTDLLRKYYNTYFKPNIAYLIIVGDIDTKEAKAVANKYFGSWKKGKVPTAKYPTPEGPKGMRVAFGARSGATQSVVMVTYPVVFTPGNPDAIKASAMNTILGGGAFFGRLMQNIREDKGWTYGSYSNLSSDRIIGSFSAQAEVRNSVSDSTVVEILSEMRRLIDEPIDESTLQMVKNFMAGNFGRSLERPQTIAEFAYNTKRFNLPANYYATYLQRLNAVTAQDIQDMARKYLKPDNAIIVVAGNIDEVPENLKKFSSTGEVEFFDPFGRAVAPPKKISGEMSASQVFDLYVKAIGGKEKLTRVEDLVMKMQMEAGTGMNLDVVTKQKQPEMYYLSVAMMGNVVSKQVLNGDKGMSVGMGQKQMLEGDQLAELKSQAIIFPELTYQKDGFQSELLGIEQIENQDAYKVKITSPAGKITTDFFSIESGLKLRSISTQDAGPMGQVTISTDYFDYKEVEGIILPYLVKQSVGPQVLNMKVLEIKINSGLTSDDFKVE